jgi:3-deoxy-7-phosphoheptulonate synthase
MLIVMKSDASASDIDRVIEIIETLGFRGHALPGENRTAIGVTGNKGAVDPAHFENLPGVDQAIRVTQPYKLISRDLRPEKSIVQVGNASVGGNELAIIAGPCAIENEKQVLTTAETVAKSGARFFRGGAFKPRTSPYAFQGLGLEGLKMLAEVRDRFGLNIVTEAMDEHGIDAVAKYGDCIQIGARNMQNFSLLKYAGQTKKPILLKRGLSATLNELLLAAEYIMAEGNYDVILCERGIRTFADHARNTMDLSIVPAVHRLTHLPIIVDPSHGTGHNYMVTPMARAGVAVGADGLIIEVHPCPEEALCDGAQALTPAQYIDLVQQVRAIHDVVAEPATILAETSA